METVSACDLTGSTLLKCSLFDHRFPLSTFTGSADVHEIDDMVFFEDRYSPDPTAPVSIAPVPAAPVPTASVPISHVVVYSRRAHAFDEKMRRAHSADRYSAAKAVLLLPHTASAIRCITAAIFQIKELQAAEEELVAHISMQQSVRGRLEARLRTLAKERRDGASMARSTAEHVQAVGAAAIDTVPPPTSTPTPTRARVRVRATHPTSSAGGLDFSCRFEAMSWGGVVASLRRFGLGHTVAESLAVATWLKARKGGWRRAVQRMRAKKDAYERYDLASNASGAAELSANNTKAYRSYKPYSTRNAKRKQSTVHDLEHRGKRPSRRNQGNGDGEGGACAWGPDNCNPVDARLHTLITPIQFVQPYAHSGSRSFSGLLASLILTEAEEARAKQLRVEALAALQRKPRYSHLKVAAAKRAAKREYAKTWNVGAVWDHSSNSPQTYYWHKVTREARWVRRYIYSTPFYFFFGIPG